MLRNHPKDHTSEWKNHVDKAVYANNNTRTILFTVQKDYKVKKNKKKLTNDQELIQSDPIPCPPNQKGKNKLHKLTAVYERHAR